MYDTIIVPLDGSAHAEAALPAAIEEARRHRATIVLLHVVARPEAPVADPHVQHGGPLRSAAVAVWCEAELTAATEAGRQYLESVRTRFLLSPLMVIRVVVGEPVRRILTEAGYWPRPLLVVTTGDDTGEHRTPLSEVARRLLVDGSTPVLGVRQSVTDAA
jgi:nucleotide-binding universal stress UspA family protein